MNTVICTLFESHYHFGVGALVNSLYKQGFRGEIFAGFRGTIPVWAKDAQANNSINLKGVKTLSIANDFSLHFLPLETEYHLTNYKPDFMLQVLNVYAAAAANIFYFDPDIVLKVPWSSFEYWITCGIALCEDVNSPLAENHPRRVSWRRYFKGYNINLRFKNSIYVNGGFIGLTAANKNFLNTWKQVQEVMALAIGGLNRSAFEGEPVLANSQGVFSPFDRTDQDALNATIEIWDGNISFIGKEGMSFQPGEAFLPHALGQPKPWHKKFILQALAGRPPRLVDRSYWDEVATPMAVYPSVQVFFKKTCLSVATFIGRFYRR